MRAIVIDDAKAMRMILRQMLGKLGFSVTEATDGDEGLRQLRSQGGADLALVDCNMPGLDGFGFLRAVRSEEGFSGLRVIMVTGEEEKAQADRAIQAGADEYLVKPFTREAVLAKLQLARRMPRLNPFPGNRLRDGDQGDVVSLASRARRCRLNTLSHRRQPFRNRVIQGDLFYISLTSMRFS